MLVGAMHKHFGETTRIFQACADMLLKCAEVDLVDYDELSQKFIISFEISDDVYELERYQYPLPFVIPPKEVKTNRDTGYYTSSGSILLRNNHHDDDVCLDHINRVNAMKLAINPDTARMVQNQWKSLDKPKPDRGQRRVPETGEGLREVRSGLREVLESHYTMGNDCISPTAMTSAAGAMLRAITSTLKAMPGTRQCSSSMTGVGSMKIIDQMSRKATSEDVEEISG